MNKMIKIIAVIILSLSTASISSAQNYQVIYTPEFDMVYFGKVEIDGQSRKNMYFIPRGLSGTPCAVTTPEGMHFYRMLHTGQYYRPFNGMFDRFMCNEINMGCYPEPWDLVGISRQDTNFLMGHMLIQGNGNTTNCTATQFFTVRSTNGGATILNVTPNQEIKGMDIDPDNDNIVYMSLVQYVYKSTNRGATFNILSGITQPIGFVKVSTQNNSILFAAGTSNMFLSTNAGSGFAQLSVPPFNDMAFDGVNKVYGVSSSGVFKSTNQGLNWTQVSSIQNVNAIEINPDNSSIIYIGTNGGIYRSINGGNTFNLQGYAFPVSSKIIGLSKDPGTGDTLYASTDKAIYRIFDLATGVNEITNIIPDEYSLHPNFPNPFNPSTTISFGLPEMSDVILIIYDGMGKEITEIVNSSLVSGSYNYTWNAGNLPSGVYFARFTAIGSSGKNYSETSKMMLLK